MIAKRKYLCGKSIGLYKIISFNIKKKVQKKGSYLSTGNIVNAL